MPSQIKKTYLSIKQKQNILMSLQNGASASKLAAQYSVHRSTITRVKQKKVHIDKFICRTEVSLGNRKTLKQPDFPKMEEALYKWFCNQRAHHIPISSHILCEKAISLHNKIKETNSKFSASSGWLKNFKKRYGIRLLKVVGEKLSNNSQAIDPFVTKFHKKVNDLNLTDDQVYNADESGLFWKMLPDKTLVRVNEKSAPGRKVIKQRITFLPCANSSGTHKLKLFVIGKAKKPRAFKNALLPILYRGNKSAWMTTSLFQTWLESTFVPEVKKYLRSQSLPQKALLLLDNAACHPSDSDLLIDGLSLTIMCFPPNCTALLQPMDQNVINMIKTNYKKSLLAHIVAVGEANIQSAINSFNLKTAVMFLVNSWTGVKQITIKNSWNVLKINQRTDMWDSDDDVPLSQLRNNLQRSRLELETIQSLLSQLPHEGEYSTNEVNDWVNEFNFQEPLAISSDEESDNDDDIQKDDKPHIKLEDAIRSFTICLEWAQQNDISMDDYMILHNLRESAVLKRNDCLRQTSISEFFKKS